MRTPIGGAWLYGIVMVFIVLFSAYLAVSINYSKVFRIKNGIINIIEQNEGLEGVSAAQDMVEAFLNQNGHFVTGRCGQESTNAYKGQPYLVNATGKARYCAYKRITPTSKPEVPIYTYYATVFFRVDLPIFGNMFTLPVSGETKEIYFAQ